MFRSSKDFQFKSPTTSVPKTEHVAYFCDMCAEGPWATEADLDIHRRDKHKSEIKRLLNDENGSICSICLRVQNNKKSLIEHILVNHFCSPPNADRINRHIYICDHCKCLFFNKQLLIIHINYWHLPKQINKTVKMECPKCWRLVPKNSLWFHLLYHGVYYLSTCPICLRICDNNAEMIDHIKEHTRYFACNICGFTTTKEYFFNTHTVKHKKKVVINDNNDVRRYFIPEEFAPSIKNRMTNVFKGIPLPNEVRICVLCRALCTSEEEMKMHIYGDHCPESEKETIRPKCVCGEEFLNNVMLRQHVFKLKGDHRAAELPPPAVTNETAEPEMLNEVYVICDPMNVGMNEIIVSDQKSLIADHQVIVMDFEEMETTEED